MAGALAFVQCIEQRHIHRALERALDLVMSVAFVMADSEDTWDWHSCWMPSLACCFAVEGKEKHKELD